jgi:amino-acid N-acetyltransferase
MTAIIRPATIEDIPEILALVNRFAGENLMLPRTAEGVVRTLADWLVAEDPDAGPDGPRVVGCGSLVPLTETLVELRSLAIHESQHGRGLGSRLVLALVELARAYSYPQICALTLRENFFIRLGFELVDRWSISPKVWQACIYCPKFHRCDEVAVLMNLAETPADAPHEAAPGTGWTRLLKHPAWQPLKLAYQRKGEA